MGNTISYLRYFFLALAALGILGIFVIRELRKRALASGEAARWREARPAPLDAAELDLLRRWQRNMRITAIATLFYLGLMVGLASSVPDQAWIVRWIAFLILPALVIAGVVLQFSVRCPRCALLLGLQSSLGVPDACERCGVSFHK